MTERVISPVFIEDALNCLRQHGMSPEPVLEQAGLSLTVNQAVSAKTYGALWTAVSEALGDELFGLGKHPMRPGSFTLLCHAVLHAENLEAAIRRMLRFLNLLLEYPSGELIVQGDRAEIVLQDARGPGSAFGYRTYWIIVHGVACWLARQRIVLKQVDFSCAQPDSGADYRTFFGAPVAFDQPVDRLVFDAKVLRQRISRTERALKEFLREAPANILVRYRHETSVSSTLAAFLRSRPPSSWPNFDVFALEVGISEATLRRRLSGEGESYQGMKNKIRRSLAMDWLINSDRSVGQVSLDLGFTEPSAFHRAFRKWTGQSPGVFRREHRVRKEPE